ncbi:hypothetical protein JKP88DRAFT_262903 [Tribonema minus]|uniref:Helicase ATP-binding domain-containing protein n=1 Tax=Tribonema minus TaxID=303371 RepID=A0A835YYI7_9STRA|nr:hypothetical protein JKP88DRAFT_262903 [Tribonema minus]
MNRIVITPVVGQGAAFYLAEQALTQNFTTPGAIWDNTFRNTGQVGDLFAFVDAPNDIVQVFKILDITPPGTGRVWWNAGSTREVLHLSACITTTSWTQYRDTNVQVQNQMSARLATFDDTAQRKLESVYGTWKAELERRELELDRAGLQLVNDKWLAVIEKEMSRVQSTRTQILQSLSKKARDELKAREREVDRKVESDLQHDARYKSLKEQVESDKQRIQRGKKAIQAMNSRSWTEIGQDWFHSVKTLLSRKADAKPLRELADEQKVLQQSVLTLEVGLQQKQEHLANLKRVAVTEAHTAFMKERIDAANATSTKLSQEVVTALNELSALVKDAASAITSAREAIHRHISAMNENLAELADAVMTHADNVHALIAKYESMHIDVAHKQGSADFMVMVLSALHTLPPMQKPRVMESRCGLAKKSDYRKMNYDSGSSTYDPEYGSDEEDRDNTGKTYPFEPETYQRAVAQMAAPSWHMNLLMYWGPGSGKTCAILLGLQRAAQYYLRHPPRDKYGVPVEPGALILMQNTAGLEEYFSELNKFCIDKDEMRGLRVREVKRPKFSDDDDDDRPRRSTSLRGRSTHAKSTKQTHPYKNSHEWCFLTKDLKRVVLRVIVHKLSSPLLVATEWRKGPIDREQKAPAGSPYWEIPRVGCIIVDEAHNLFDTSQMKTSQHSNHAVKFIDQMVARPDIRRLFSTGTPVADSSSFTNLMKLLDLLRHPSPPGADMLASAPACTQTVDLESDTGRMTDIDELEDIAKASKQADRNAINEQLRKYAIERAVRKPWFYQLPNDDYMWKPCAEHTFKQMMYGFVSYVNMEADATAFPQFGVQWSGRKYPKGMVYTKFRPSDFDIAESGLSTELAQKRKEKQTDDLLRKFCTWFEKAMKEDSTIAADDPMKKPELFTLPSRYNDTWTDEQVEQHVIALNKGPDICDHVEPGHQKGSEAMQHVQH